MFKLQVMGEGVGWRVQKIKVKESETLEPREQQQKKGGKDCLGSVRATESKEAKVMENPVAIKGQLSIS